MKIKRKRFKTSRLDEIMDFVEENYLHLELDYDIEPEHVREWCCNFMDFLSFKGEIKGYAVFMDEEVTAPASSPGGSGYYCLTFEFLKIGDEDETIIEYVYNPKNKFIEKKIY